MIAKVAMPRQATANGIAGFKGILVVTGVGFGGGKCTAVLAAPTWPMPLVLTTLRD